MARSKPFEVRLGKIEDGEELGLTSAATRSKVEAALLPIVRNCFDRDPQFAPEAVDEAFGEMVEREGKFAKRVVFALRQMVSLTQSSHPPPLSLHYPFFYRNVH